MGSIARSAANLITTSGVVLKGAVNNDSFDNVTALPSSFGDGITLISSQTASSSASLSFTTGITSTYKAYKFVFIDIHPSGNSAHLNFNLSTDGGSNYNVTKTSTYFYASNGESGANIGSSLDYWSAGHLAQSTSDQNIARNQNADNDSIFAGSLLLFNPSSTTYVKHYISRALSIYHEGSVNGPFDQHMAGYANTTSAINAIIFRLSSGNMDAGKILMYGIK
jgi:hypothetical protein